MGNTLNPTLKLHQPWRHTLHTAWRLRRLSWAEWRVHPWRQVAALVAVVLGVALAFSVHLINESALAEFGAAVRSANGQPDASLVPSASNGLDEVWLDRLLLHPAVQVALPRVSAESLLLLPSGQRPPLRLLGVDPLNITALAPELLPRPDAQWQAAAGQEGGDARFAVLRPGVAYVNPALEAHLRREASKAKSASAVAASAPASSTAPLAALRFLLEGQPVEIPVVGRVSAGGAPLAVFDLASAQALFGQVGRLGRIDLRLHPGQTLDALRTGPNALHLPAGLRLETPEEAGQRASNLSRAYRVNLTVLALVALLVGAFMVFSVMSLSVAQRTPQWALLGVMGLAANERKALVLSECALIGLVASLLGLALGAGMAAAALHFLAGDLGGGYFGSGKPVLHVSAGAALVFGALGLAAAVVGGTWPARQAAALSPSQALKGMGQVAAEAPPWWPGVLLLALALGLALLPPVGGLPLAAYASVAAALVGGISLVPWVVFMLLGRRGSLPLRFPLWLLGAQRARHYRSTATAAVAGVVASLALCVALTVMVTSFRLAVADWLEGVLPADLYLRSTAPGRGSEQVFFPPGWAEHQAAEVRGVQKVLPGRGRALSLRADLPEIWLQARPLGPDPAQSLPLLEAPLPLAPGETGVFVAEAVQALYGVAPGGVLYLPIGQASGESASQPGTRMVALRVRGVWRDYARQGGSVALDLADYQRLSGDTRLNDLAVWLAPGASQADVDAGLRASAQAAGADPGSLSTSSAAQLKQLSMQIFDRSFAVTRYLQAVAIAIGLAGVAASLSAQVLARRREFGLLAHLGLTRRQVLALVVVETACWLMAGLVVGLALGVAISAVLVFVVNPQSFHWTMPLHVPPLPMAALAGAVLLAGLVTAALATRKAIGRNSADLVRSVREDW